MKAQLIIMAKQPVPGQVKTRLVPDYGEAGAAAIAEFLLNETVSNARQYWPGEIVLSVAPDCNHPVVQQLSHRYSFGCRPQCEGDLGMRMQHEVSQSVGDGSYAVVIGTDVPHALEQALAQAWQAVQQGKTVIAPSSDGGYYLLGMKQMHEDLFNEIPWGSDEVYTRTCNVLKKGKTAYLELAMATDIDTAEDLQQVAASYRPLQKFV